MKNEDILPLVVEIGARVSAAQIVFNIVDAHVPQPTIGTRVLSTFGKLALAGILGDISAEYSRKRLEELTGWIEQRLAK